MTCYFCEICQDAYESEEATCQNDECDHIEWTCPECEYCCPECAPNEKLLETIQSMQDTIKEFRKIMKTRK